MYKLSPLAVALCAPFLLSACHEAGDESYVAGGDTGVEIPAPEPAASPPSPAAEIGEPVPRPVPTLVPDAEKGETGARNVLLAWARALENGDFATAYAQWGENGGRSGMTRREFADHWGQYRRLTVAVPTGEMDAGAGSIFYTVPTTITGEQADGTPFRLEGTLRMRRANDVPGATPAELRWHIEGLDLAPA